MAYHNQEESNDPVWQLLSRSGEPRIEDSFSRLLVEATRTTYQDSSPAPSIRQLFSGAPFGWQAAAAAIVLVSASLGLTGLLSDPDPARLSVSVEADVSIAIVDWKNHDESSSGLAPLDDILATDELDKMLQIEEGDSLENEDLLLLLIPDWELL
ncbi:MAG: hypothetical protein KDN22_11190 [Verrucomicrobiae bacterium]|nr:hypothetical protein [Verrucomicrobiae bacterium]